MQSVNPTARILEVPGNRGDWAVCPPRPCSSDGFRTFHQHVDIHLEANSSPGIKRGGQWCGVLVSGTTNGPVVPRFPTRQPWCSAHSLEPV
jgi:hypothetical protein